MGPGLGGEEVVLGGAEGGPPGPLAQEAWQGHQLEDQEVGGDIYHLSGHIPTISTQSGGGGAESEHPGPLPAAGPGAGHQPRRRSRHPLQENPVHSEMLHDMLFAVSA